MGRLSDNASIFTAELTAISKSLEIVSTLQGSNFTIYSDSLSALSAICEYNSQHPIIQRIQEWLYRLSSKFKSVNFCWVPAHVGIAGNELADHEAKSAISGDGNIYQYIPQSDMKWIIRSHVKGKWQARWSGLASNKKYKEIREDIKHWPSSYQYNRRAEVILSRLRIGHTRLTHGFLLEGGIAPVCSFCNSPLTIEHILVYCNQFSAARRQHGMANKCIKELLGQDVDILNIISFLQETGLLSQI